MSGIDGCSSSGYEYKPAAASSSPSGSASAGSGEVAKDEEQPKLTFEQKAFVNTTGDLTKAQKKEYADMMNNIQAYMDMKRKELLNGEAKTKNAV